MTGLVTCKHHRRAQYLCYVCRTAVEINRRTLHERGLCGQLGRCIHCEVFGGTDDA